MTRTRHQDTLPIPTSIAELGLRFDPATRTYHWLPR